ncbi:MAG: type IV secretory system conjugative DNA transfer family protein [Vicingaceae bacterium]
MKPNKIGFWAFIAQKLSSLFGKGAKKEHSNNKNKLTDPLDKELIRFGKAGAITTRTANSSTIVFGATGSGKTSSTSRLYNTAFLKAGMGGLVLTVKNDVLAEWKAYMKETGRSEDLIVISEKNPYRFNFLEYELNRSGEGGGNTTNIIDLLMTIVEMGNSEKGNNNNSDSFWTDSLRELLTNVVDLLRLSSEKLTMENIDNVILSMPESLEEVTEENWQVGSYCFECLSVVEKLDRNKEEEIIYDQLLKYFLKKIASLDERTRSNILATYSSSFNYFQRGILRELFCTATNISPEMTFEGKVILINLPVLEYNKVGQFAQTIFKYLFQKSVERRLVKKDTRNVFLTSDEFQYTLVDSDILFQSTCRSAKCSVLYLTQSIEGLYSRFPNNGKNKVESLLASMTTKIFHSNNSNSTNEYAAKTIGRIWDKRANFNRNQRDGGAAGVNVGEASSVEFQILPYSFSILKTGGPIHNFQVEAIITIAGKLWANNKNYLKVIINQKNNQL